MPPEADEPSRGRGPRASSEAQRLVEGLQPPQHSLVFRRHRALPSRRLADPSPSPTASPPTSPRGLQLRQSQALKSSYGELPEPPVECAATQRAAETLQRAWRRYRIQSARSFSALGGEALQLVQQFIAGQAFAERSASQVWPRIQQRD